MTSPALTALHLPPMLTAETLLAMAAQAEARYQGFIAQGFGPGTVHEGRNSARHQMEEALACAEWLEGKRADGLRFVGPFGEPPVGPHDRVTIRKGARIFGTGPEMTREGKVLARKQTIFVHSIHQGFVETIGREHPIVRQPTVHWAGAGGYWRWTDLNNLEGALAHGAAVC